MKRRLKQNSPPPANTQWQAASWAMPSLTDAYRQLGVYAG
jgi:hypothetical protein